METINIHHVGGIGDCGPAEKLKNLECNWIVYDAEGDNLEVTKRDNITYVNKCLGDHNGTTLFYEFVNPSANSIFPSDPSAYNYEWKDGLILSWGKWTKVKNVKEINVNTFDNIQKELNLPDIDVLSMDCQGSEYLIMKGITDWSGILCIILEVRFTRLYTGEAMYPEVLEFLENKGFELAYMGPKSVFNDGEKEFYVHAEPVFIRKECKEKEEKLRSIKSLWDMN